MKCEDCPRRCGIDRLKMSGFCGQTEKVRICKVMFHHYEEPIISGDEHQKGSGAIFFSGCNLKCEFCQNYKISHGNKGKNISVKKLAKIFKELERKGALNINLVTPTHFTNQIINALKIYKPQIPIVWNSNGYELDTVVDKLKGLVDIFLVDLKYMNNNIAMKFSKANNYVENATAVIKKMRELQSCDVIENGLMKRGVIVRHLILPGCSSDSIKCLEFIKNNIGKETIVSLMSQYYPCYNAHKYPEINKRISKLEYKRVVSYAQNNEMINCFTQELDSANEKYTPKF